MGRAAVSGLAARGGRRGGRPDLLASFLVVRGEDLTRLMVTLGIGLMLYEAANQASSITGGVDGLSGVAMSKLFGLFALRLDGKTAYVYSLVVLFVVFVLRAALVRLAVRPEPARHPRRRATDAGASACRFSASCVASSRSAPAIAGVAGALLAQTTQFVGIDTLGFPRSAELLIMLVLGGAGRLYGGIARRGGVHAAAGLPLRDLSPVYWQFWLGLLLVLHRAVRARRAAGRPRDAASRCVRGAQAAPMARSA